MKCHKLWKKSNITFIRNVYISNFSQIQNSPHYPRVGGGVKKIMDFFHNLWHFMFGWLPLPKVFFSEVFSPKFFNPKTPLDPKFPLDQNLFWADYLLQPTSNNINDAIVMSFDTIEINLVLTTFVIFFADPLCILTSKHCCCC